MNYSETEGEQDAKTQLGWPRAKRQEEFAKSRDETKINPGPTYRMTFKDQIHDFPIYRLPIELPKYRLANGRTASMQQEYMAQHSSLESDFFECDPELQDVQGVQHGLLLRLAKEAQLLGLLKDPKTAQAKPIILDQYGFVLDGNRRLSIWRKLYQEDNAKYAHLSHIDMIVLPRCEEDELDRIESQLQIQRDARADYSWHAEALMIENKREKRGWTDRQIANFHKTKVSEIRESIDMRKAAADYLRYCGKENHWSLVDDDKFAFKQIVKFRRQIKDSGEKELFTQSAFNLIAQSSKEHGSLYSLIPKIKEHLSSIKEKLSKQFKPRDESSNPGLTDLFGPGDVNKDSKSALELSMTIADADTQDDIRELIIESIDSGESIKGDRKKAKFLIDKLARANTLLEEAISAGKTEDTELEGVDQQLKTLTKQIQIISGWLSNPDA